MINVRRWYLYIICTVSLQAAAWAAVNLIYTLSETNLFILDLATPIATLVVGIPVFLAHWMWANRLVKTSLEERGSSLRRLFLYGNLAVFLLHAARQTVYILYHPLPFVLGVDNPGSTFEVKWMIVSLAVLLVMLGLCAFLFYTIRWDAQLAPEKGSSAVPRRLFVYVFSGYGLSVVVMAGTFILRMVLGTLIKGFEITRQLGQGLVLQAVWLIMGTAVWYIFWRIANNLFKDPDPAERESSLRKFYLYLAVFVGTLAVVTYSAIILTGLLKRLLQAPSSGGGDVYFILPIILSMGMVWFFHAVVLRDDMQVASEAPRQAAIRRWYLYLVAAVGLSSLLTGLTGDINVILRSLGSNLGFGLREEFAAYTAAIIAGTPVWLIPWMKANAEASLGIPSAADARRSNARKIYLYFFLLAATLAVLGSAIYIVSSLVRYLLGESAPTINEIGFAISTTLLGIGVWLYHGSLLRGDARAVASGKARALKAWKVVILDAAENQFGKELSIHLKREFPDMEVDGFSLSQTMSKKELTRLVAGIRSAGLIIGPWWIAMAGGAQGLVPGGVAEAVTASPAEKLLFPVGDASWHWLGLARNRSTDALIRQASREIKALLGREAE